MADTTYFELRLTATTSKLYDYLKNTCLSHGSYLNPIKLGSFIHGQTDNFYTKDGHHVKAIDESLPEVDEGFDGIKWLVGKSKWLDNDPRITAPELQYIEIINMNPFQENGKLTYYQPMTRRDWKGYFLPDGKIKNKESDSFIAAPNGHLYLSPTKGSKNKEISVLISKKKRNDGIITMFNVAFTLKVDGEPYFCIIDPVIKVKTPRVN